MSTATPIPRSAHSPSADASLAPSPSASRNIATEPTPSASASAASQSLAPSTAWLPVETRVWKSIPRLEPIALTATLPLCETIATRPGRSLGTESPQSGARPWTATTPFPFGPQTGKSASSAIRASSASSPRPASISPKPAANAITPPQPRAIESPTTAGTFAAGIATTTASTGSGSSSTLGTHSRPWTSVRVGWTPQTAPSYPARSRLRRTVSA